MHLTLLTPDAALFALSAAVPVVVALWRLRRLRGMRAVLGLEEPRLRTLAPPVVALALVPCLLGAAATQPVIETSRSVRERTDAEAFVVLDTTRSMLASQGPSGSTRFERAQRIAVRLADELPELPIGLASVTDRVLPYVFPTTDRPAFDATVEKAAAVEQPPPSDVYLTEATALGSLARVPELNYFTPAAKKRVLVVLTDGETQPAGQALAAAFRRRPRIATFFVRIGQAGERIYTGGTIEGGYRPRTSAAVDLSRIAALTGGRVFTAGQAGELAASVRTAIGQGPTVERREEGGRTPLMPYLTMLALVPLAFVLAVRNVWWRGLRLPFRPWRRRELPASGGTERTPEAGKVSEPRGVAQPG